MKCPLSEGGFFYRAQSRGAPNHPGNLSGRNMTSSLEVKGVPQIQCVCSPLHTGCRDAESHVIEIGAMFVGSIVDVQVFGMWL